MTDIYQPPRAPNRRIYFVIGTLAVITVAGAFAMSFGIPAYFALVHWVGRLL